MELASASRGDGLTDYERGLAQFAKMVGDDKIAALIEGFKAASPEFEREVVAVVGGRAWSRGTIDLKTRSLCSIAILASLGRQSALRLNFEMALNNGATVEELTEALLQVAVYAGFPAAWDALIIMRDVVDRL
jgi:4-carboxymuconolactone decarboxylase